MVKIVRPVIVSLVVFTFITGIVYPLSVTVVAQLLFPVQANGSVMMNKGKPAGSSLIGQPFNDPKYFWGRLSATPPFPYNAASSGGSNLAQTNPDLLKQAQERIARLHAADPQTFAPVPVDLATASGSGLDPHISPAAAEYQIKRVAKTRGIDEEKVRMLVTKFTEDRLFGIVGEPRVNVLELNTTLDETR
jgi:potassium-transporting ATPase KdpC subunit